MTKSRIVDTAVVERTRLFVGMLAALVVSLSVHVVMLQALCIPFPEFRDVPPWASLLNTTLAVLSVILVCDLARPRLARFPVALRYLIVFLLYVMLKETFRGIVMNGVVTGDWRFCLLSGLPSLASGLVLTGLVLLLSPLLRALWTKVAGAAAIAAMVVFAVKPLFNHAFALVLHAATPLDHADRYAFPYGWQVLLPAYLTYAEPVIACTLMASLIWQALSPHTATRLLQFVVLVLLMRSMLLPTFLYSAYSRVPLASAMLSQSQFLFETITLAALIGLTWRSATRLDPQDASGRLVPAEL